MEITHIGSGAAAAVLVMIAFGVIIPLASIIIWKIISKKPLGPYFCGWLIFLLFAIILESIPQLLLFGTGKADAGILKNSPALYTAVAALMAGIFEETGRLVAFKVFLKKHTDRATAVTYGLGHGGFEVIVTLLIGGIGTLTTIFMVNSGQYQAVLEQTAQADPAQAQALKDTLDKLAESLTLASGFVAVYERLIAMTLHIGLSMIMFCAVRKSGKFWLYPAAIVLHAIVDVPAALYQVGVFKNTALVEALTTVIVIPVFLFAYLVVYKKWMADLEEKEPEIIPIGS